jgi:hypothetical protein
MKVTNLEEGKGIGAYLVVHNLGLVQGGCGEVSCVPSITSITTHTIVQVICYTVPIEFTWVPARPK